MSNQDNLRRLKGADRIRLNVNVMLGSDDIKGVRQGLFEITSNSIDRFRRGYGDFIEVIKREDLSYEVIDFADGLPMDWNEDEKAYNWDLAMRVLYAGGNYDKDSESLGQHGLGLASTCMSSEFATVVVRKNGFKYTVKMKQGRPVDKDTGGFLCDDSDDLLSKELGERVLKVERDTSGKTGTHIHWKPDQSIFTNTDISVGWIVEKLKKQAIVNRGLKIKIYDEITNFEQVLSYENGIVDYVEEINDGKAFTETIIFNGKSRGSDGKGKPDYDYRYEIALAFNNEVNKVEYYHNSSELLQGGSTAEAIEKALTDAIHKYCQDKNLYKKNKKGEIAEKKIRYSDVSDSLVCVISSFSNRTSFANQTKLAINNKFIRDYTTKSLTDHLEVFLIENKEVALKICNQVLVNKRSSESAEKTRLAVKKKFSTKVDSINSTVEGFIDCELSTGGELFLTEGKSALGSIILARDPHFQAGYPLRGKLINALKNKLDKVLKNEEIIDIIRLLGCGIEIKSKYTKDLPQFNIENLRWKKIILTADADSDGKQINVLILTNLYKLCPSLITEGYVYIALPPLFEIKVTDSEKYYALTISERDRIIKERVGNRRYEVHRLKG